MAIERIDLDQQPIWSIQSDETTTQYRAFCLYRDLLGARSLSRVTEVLIRERIGDDQVSKSERLTPKRAPGVIQGWSARNRWVERADAYELHLEQQRRQERETENARIEARQRTAANVALSGMMRRLVGYTDPADKKKSVEPMDWSKLTPSEVAHFAKVFGDELRLLMNKPTSLNRNIMSIDRKDYEDTVTGLIEIFMRHLPEERRALAAEQANAFLAGGV